jgi:hypothetical protein
MTKLSRLGSIGVMGLLVTSGASAQGRAPVQDPVLQQVQQQEPIVKGAPYSGEGITTVKLTLYDGTKMERTVTAKFYRDSEGRVRREQTVLGLEALDPNKDVRAMVTIIDPGADAIYTLIPGSKTAMRVSMSTIRNTPAPPPPMTQLTREEGLGTKDIDGITAVGRRTITTIPAGQVGNDRPIEIIDERWDSPALKVLMRSLHHDPRTGDVEYVLTKISRAEPAASLFTVPAGYTIKSVDQIRSNPQPMTSSRRLK